MSWSAERYLAFEAERTRPVRDLLSVVPARPIGSAIDLGCGPGNSTEVLTQLFPAASISGLDSSAAMIAAARARLPQVDFRVADIAAWDAPGPFDLILANASLHWLPDHAGLLPRLAGKLAPGGHLAIQMPDNLAEPAHRLIREVAAEEPWCGRLAESAAARQALGSAEWFYDRLRPLCAGVTLWRTVYYHALAGGAGDIVDWFRGSGLRPFLARLDEAERPVFLDRYKAALQAAYPFRPDGSVLLAFPRLFIVGRR